MGLARLLHVAGVLALAGLLAACAALGQKPLAPPAPVMPAVDIPSGGFFTVNGTLTEVLSDAQLAGLASGARYILVGEGHASACDHMVQARVLRALASAGRRPAVGLEMVSVEREPLLERFNRGEIPLDDLEKALDWRAFWGFPLDLYGPVFEVALELRLPMAALNLPKDVTRALSTKGVQGLTPQEAAWMPYQLIPPPAGQRASLEEEFNRHRHFRMDKVHGGDKAKGDDKPNGDDKANADKPNGEGKSGDDDKPNGKDPALERFLAVQSAWDSKMAEAAVEAWDKYERPLVILVGSGHVEHGWGIPSRLRGLDPGAGILTIAPWRGGEPVDPLAADAFFHCHETHESRLGFTLESLQEGALVMAVIPGSKAEAAGFLKGDLMVEVGGQAVTGLWAMHKAAAMARAKGQPLEFVILREGGRLTLSIPLAELDSAGPAGKE